MDTGEALCLQKHQPLLKGAFLSRRDLMPSGDSSHLRKAPPLVEWLSSIPPKEFHQSSCPPPSAYNMQLRDYNIANVRSLLITIPENGTLSSIISEKTWVKGQYEGVLWRKEAEFLSLSAYLFVHFNETHIPKLTYQWSLGQFFCTAVTWEVFLQLPPFLSLKQVQSGFLSNSRCYVVDSDIQKSTITLIFKKKSHSITQIRQR